MKTIAYVWLKSEFYFRKVPVISVIPSDLSIWSYWENLYKQLSKKTCG